MSAPNDGDIRSLRAVLARAKDMAGVRRCNLALFMTHGTPATRLAARAWCVAEIASRTNEQDTSVVEAYRAAEERWDAASKALEAHFLPRIRDKLAAGNIVGARALAARMPHSVPWAFAMDAIRQAAGGS